THGNFGAATGGACMSNGRRRGPGLVAIVLALLVAGGAGLWLVRSRPSDRTTQVAAGRASPGARGRGTSWRDEEAPPDQSGALEGVVLDADGKPIDGALVALGRGRARNEEVTPFSFVQPRGSAVTAGGGHFRIEHLVPAEYAATASARGWAPAYRGSLAVKAR